MRVLISIAIVLALAFVSTSASAAGDVKPPKKLNWPFEGITGTFDRQAAQRGFQVYKEVCASCHGLKRVAYRNLMEIGFSEGEVKTIAAEALIPDGPNDDGEMFERAGRPSDRFAEPYPNAKAAMAANGGAMPPDLSLIVKARVDGANYLYSLLTGYEKPPADFELGDGLQYNPYFPGGQIAMVPPLASTFVEYMDGTEATADQMSRDVTIFLQWAAEPEMEARKSMGIKVMLFLFILTGLFIVANRRTWKDVKK